MRFLTISTPVLSLLAGVFLGLGTDETSEPPLTATLVFDGEEHSVVLGEDFDLKLGAKKHSLRITIDPTRRLDLTDFSFEYPTDFSFEFDPSEGVDSWYLDGEDALMMINREEHGVTPEDSFDAYLESFLEHSQEEELPHTEEVELELGERTFAGRRVVLNMGSGFYAAYYIYPIGRKPGRIEYTVMFQDLLEGVEEQTEEFLETRRLFTESFRWAD